MSSRFEIQIPAPKSMNNGNNRNGNTNNNNTNNPINNRINKPGAFSLGSPCCCVHCPS